MCFWDITVSLEGSQRLLHAYRSLRVWSCVCASVASALGTKQQLIAIDWMSHQSSYVSITSRS